MAVTRPALCPSGSFSVPRAQFKAEALRGAFSVCSSPSRNCDLLVIGERPSRKKIVEALERGIPVVSEQTARAVFTGRLPLADAAQQAVFAAASPSTAAQGNLKARLDPFLASLLGKRTAQHSWFWELNWLGYERLGAGQATASDFYGLSELARGLEVLAVKVPGKSVEQIGEFACLYGPSRAGRLLELVEQQLLLSVEQLNSLCDEIEDELLHDGAKRIAVARKRAAKKFPLLAQAVETALREPGVFLDHDLFLNARVHAAGKALGLQMNALGVGWPTLQGLALLIPYSRYKRSY